MRIDHRAVGFLFLTGVAGTAAAQVTEASPAPPRYALQPLDDRLRIEIDGALFSEYRHGDVEKPFFYPVIGAHGTPMTRNWPMQESADEEHDHVHQRSLWFAHGDVNGHDFWAEAEGHGRIVHRKFSDLATSATEAAFVAHSDWLAADGKRICTDTRRVRVQSTGAGRVLFDFDITLQASDGALHLGDTKEGTMAIRLTPALRLRGKVAKGHCVTSEGVRDLEAWGKRARWIDYSGPVGERVVGVAIFDHPGNHAHPTWWHARDYGLFAANPFGVHDFEGKPAGTGDLTVAAGGELRLRYRFFFHAGDAEAAGVAERYREYAEQPPSQPTEKNR